MRSQLSLIAVTLALSFANATAAQDNGELPPNSSTAYLVGPGDVLEIDVYDDPDLSRLATVQHAGEISFPLLGDITVAGMTVKEVQATLVELLAKDYLVDPQVSVRVKEFRSQWVTLTGEVVRPGKYYLQGSKSMLDLLTEAGGFTSRASGEVIVSRLDQQQPSLFMTEDNGNGAESAVRIFLTPDQPPSKQKEALSFRLRSGDIRDRHIDSVLLHLGRGETARLLPHHWWVDRAQGCFRRRGAHQIRRQGESRDPAQWLRTYQSEPGRHRERQEAGRPPQARGHHQNR